ncbi:hypothetical protein CACET_c15270 [Clostridium aceticum]|uniref:Uncharacterized protein n=2 Tax=Clostridium aceticum TaxID=84022 RepID=A0A0G3W8L0_9CLOT|nr:hypothetical protein CACET_c15270 [Clostridium aceticum]
MDESKLSIENFFLITKNLFAGNELLYISTPITTGQRFIDWYDSIGKNLDRESRKYSKEMKNNVVYPNIENAKKCIENIRKATNKLIIDPTNLEDDLLQWTQDEFYQFWDRVIKDLVDEIVFLDGWEYSIGCCHEYLSAVENNIKAYNSNMEVLSLAEAKRKMSMSINMYESYQLQEAYKISNILSKLLKYEENDKKQFLNKSDHLVMKDEKLHFLISNKIANIAQFISFEPNTNLVPKHVHINGFQNEKVNTTEKVIEELILSAPSKSVNIRSFSPEAMKGNRLVFNKTIKEIDCIMNTVKENSLDGKHSIINENININDGGVSGVALGDVIEFSPEDTPKCVDKEGVCSLPRTIALKILRTVYGFTPDINFDTNYRIEFSIHPSRQGVNRQHTIIWEYEYYENINSNSRIFWPNRFSKFIGDKVFGLLIADVFGLPVPKTTVISRKIAPFSFGVETGLKEKWIRTCPIKKEPGKYYTGLNWTDPFELMRVEEAKGVEEINLASILSQDAVEAVFSGASFVRADEKNDLIEGVAGKGDKFMVGERNKEILPIHVINAVKNLNDQIRIHYNKLGHVSIEWVYDGVNVWVVQLNQLIVNNERGTDGQRVIVDGNPSYYEKVSVKDGLDHLREKIELYKDKNIGIELVGNIGITSHFGDLLRISNIPSILKREN